MIWGHPTARHLISAYAIGSVCRAPLTVVVAGKLSVETNPIRFGSHLYVWNVCASYRPVIGRHRSCVSCPHFPTALSGCWFFIVAERVADRRESQAVSLMIAGITIANLFGVPFGTMLRNLNRGVFLLPLTAWGLFTFYLVWKWVPFIPGIFPDTGFKGQFRFLKTCLLADQMTHHVRVRRISAGSVTSSSVYDERS